MDRRTLTIILVGAAALSTAFAITQNTHAKNNKTHTKESFLISKKNYKKRQSKTELKQDLGGELKQALYSCNNIVRELAKVQGQLAALQHRLLSRVEDLIANKKPVKKASRGELTRAIEIMNDARHRLAVQRRGVRVIGEQMDTCKCLEEKDRALAQKALAHKEKEETKSANNKIKEKEGLA